MSATPGLLASECQAKVGLDCVVNESTNLSVLCCIFVAVLKVKSSRVCLSVV